MDDLFEEMPLWDGWQPDPTLHEYDQHIQRMLRDLAESDARAWFSKSPGSTRLLFEFNQSETDDIIASVYAQGADDVRVLSDQDTINKGGSVDMLLVVLPSDRETRKRLFDLSTMVAGESGFEGHIDEGQRYLLLRWT